MHRTVWRTSMYRYWINRRKLWFKSMVMCLFSVCWCCAHECLFSCYAFALYMLCMRFHVSELKSEREREWGSFVSLSEPGDSCKVCSRIHPQGVCWWRLSSLTSVLTHPEVEVGCWSHARSAQAEEEVSVVNLRRKEIKDCYCRSCTESKKFEHLKCL